MTRKPKRPAGPKPKRNPMARALRQGPFHKRVVERPDTYKRRPKHPKPPETDGSGS